MLGFCLVQGTAVAQELVEPEESVQTTIVVEPTADDADLITPEISLAGEESGSTDSSDRQYLEVLQQSATEGGNPARIKVLVPPLPDRYSLELRLDPEQQRTRGEDLDLPPREILAEIHDQSEPVIEIPAWDDGLAEDSEWAEIQVWITGTSASGQSGEKQLGTARIRIIDNDGDPAFGRTGWYRWLRGYPYDYSGLGNHGRIEKARYTEQDQKAALVFTGEDDFVELSPSLKAPETGGAAATAPETGALAHYSYLHKPFNKWGLTIWFRADDTFEGQVLYEEGDARNGVSLVLVDGDLIFHTASDGLTTSVRAAVDGNDWIHCGAVFDEGQQRLYINGLLWDDTAAVYTEIGFRPEGAYLSRGAGTGPDCENKVGFAGMIGETALYDRALDEPLIRAIVMRGQVESEVVER